MSAMMRTRLESWACSLTGRMLPSITSLEKTVKSIHLLGVRVLGSVFNRMRYEMPSILDRML